MNREEMQAHELFNGNFVAYVDHERKEVLVDERGGWGRTYTESFKQLQKLAKKWQVVFDLKGSNAAIADTGCRIMMAEHAIAHGLKPDVYIKLPNNLSDENKKVLKQFEELVKVHGASTIFLKLNKRTREALEKALGG